MKVLQTSPLPLGYRAPQRRFPSLHSTHFLNWLSVYRRSPSEVGLILRKSASIYEFCDFSSGRVALPAEERGTAGEDEPQPRWLVHDDQARVHAALLEVELPLQRPQTFIINLPFVAQPDQRLALNEKHRQNRRIPLGLIDDPVW
jgi:hypothetical protein